MFNFAKNGSNRSLREKRTVTTVLKKNKSIIKTRLGCQPFSKTEDDGTDRFGKLFMLFYVKLCYINKENSKTNNRHP